MKLLLITGVTGFLGGGRAGKNIERLSILENIASGSL